MQLAGHAATSRSAIRAMMGYTETIRSSGGLSVASRSAGIMDREEILRYIRSQKDYLRSTYHVRKIALIGSFARNEQSADSDVDLIVDLDEGTPNIFELKRSLRKELEQHFHRNVEIASERYLKPYFRKRILQDAIYV